MNKEAESNQEAKEPNKGRFWRNIWLGSIFVFLVSIILLVAPFALTTNNETLIGLVGLATLPMILSAVVGMFSFSAWLSIKSSHKFNIFKLIIGMPVSVIIFLTLFTIAEFLMIDAGMREGDGLYLLTGYLVPFLIFLVTLILWAISKNFRNYIIIVAILLVTYGIGKIYAEKRIQPFYQAEQLLNEADETRDTWINKKDCDSFLSGARNYVSKYEKASSLNFGYENQFKGYYKDLYTLKKEALISIEKQCSVKMTEQERSKEGDRLNEQTKEVNERLKNPMLARPFWMGYYLIKLDIKSR